jgi:drug/metabolite transporter (DMT)-like permease
MGLKLTQAILAAFLIASIPIFTMLAAHIYLKEKLTSKLIVASLVALVGVILIIGKFEGPLNTKELIGNSLLLVSTVFWVIHEIIAKKLLKTYDGSIVAFYTMAIGAATFAPLLVWELLKDPVWFQGVDIQGYSGLLYGIFFASLTAYWAWQKGLKLMPAGHAAFFFYLDPISGAILAMLLLGEKLTPSLAAGGLLICLAVLLAEQKRKSHPLIRK